MFGDLDFASDGDGRWDISWRFVPCEASTDQTFLFEGSHEYYWKVGVVRFGVEKWGRPGGQARRNFLFCFML